MRIIASFFGILLLCSCTIGGYPIRMKPLQPTEQGYEAVRFRRFTTVPDHAINVFAFSAGTVLVKDRQMDGVPYYCGLSSVNQMSGEFCYVIEGQTLILGYGTFKEVRRDLGDGIEHIMIAG